MADNSSAAAPENLVQWLEEEQHQQKVTLFKIQQQLEQQQNTILDLWQPSELSGNGSEYHDGP